MASHMFSLKKLPTNYIFRLAFHRMIEGNTYHNGYGVPAVKKCGIMRLTARRCRHNGQSASFSARHNIIIGKDWLYQRFAVLVFLACYSKHEISLSPSLASGMTFLQLVSMHGKSVQFSYDRHHEKHKTGYRPNHFLPNKQNKAILWFDLEFLTWPWNIKVMSWAHSVDYGPKPLKMFIEYYGIFLNYCQCKCVYLCWIFFCNKLTLASQSHETHDPDRSTML